MSITHERLQASPSAPSERPRTLGGFARQQWAIALNTMSSIRNVLAAEYRSPRENNPSQRTACELTEKINRSLDAKVVKLIAEVEQSGATLDSVAPFCKQLDAIVHEASRELNVHRYGKMNKYKNVLKQVLLNVREAFDEWSKEVNGHARIVVRQTTSNNGNSDNGYSVDDVSLPVDSVGEGGMQTTGTNDGVAHSDEATEQAPSSYSDLLAQIDVESDEQRVVFIRKKLASLISNAYWGYLVSLCEEPMNFGKKLRAKEVKSLVELYTTLTSLVQDACTVESTASRAGIISSVSAALSSIAGQPLKNPDERLLLRCEATVFAHIRSFLESKEDDEIFVLSLLDLQSSDDFANEDTIRELLLWQKLEAGESYPMLQAERRILGHGLSGKRVRMVRSMLNNDEMLEKLASQMNEQCHGGYALRTAAFVRSMIDAHYLKDNGSRATTEESFDAPIAEDGDSLPIQSFPEVLVHSESEIPQSFPQAEIDAAKVVLRQEGLTDYAFLTHGNGVKKLWQRASALAYDGRSVHAGAEYRRALFKSALEMELSQANAELHPTLDAAARALKIRAMEEQERRTVAVMVANHRKRGGEVDDEFVHGLTNALNIKRVREHITLLTIEDVRGVIPPPPVRETIAIEHVPIVDQRSPEERFLSHFVEYIRTCDALGGVLEERMSEQRVSIVEVLIDELEQHLQSRDIQVSREVVKRTVLYGLEHAHLPHISYVAADKRDPTAWIMAELRREVYGNAFMPSMRACADYVRANIDTWDGGRSIPELRAYLAARREQEHVLDLGPVARRAPERTPVMPMLKRAPVLPHQETLIEQAVEPIDVASEPPSQTIDEATEETAPAAVDARTTELGVEDILVAPASVGEATVVMPEPDVAPADPIVEPMEKAVAFEDGGNLMTWVHSLSEKIAEHISALEVAAVAIASHADAIYEIESGMNALQDSVERIRLPARQAVAFCQNAMLHAKTLKPGALDIQEQSMRAHVAVIDSFEAVTARLLEQIAAIDAQKRELVELSKPYLLARDFIKLLQHPSLAFPKEAIGDEIIAEMSRTDALVQSLARRIEHSRSDMGDMWEHHVEVCPQDDRAGGLLSIARNNAEFVLNTLKPLPPKPAGRIEGPSSPADISSVSYLNGNVETSLSDVQVRCLQLLTTQTLSKKAVRHTSWGHTSAKIREYWVKVFGEPAPSIAEIELALSHPSIMHDERTNETKVVTGAMRGLPALVCMWKLGDNELFLPTHRAFDLMNESGSSLEDDELLIFQELKEREQQSRKEFRDRYSKKKKALTKKK